MDNMLGSPALYKQQRHRWLIEDFRNRYPKGRFTLHRLWNTTSKAYPVLSLGFQKEFEHPVFIRERKHYEFGRTLPPTYHFAVHGDGRVMKHHESYANQHFDDLEKALSSPMGAVFAAQHPDAARVMAWGSKHYELVKELLAPIEYRDRTKEREVFQTLLTLSSKQPKEDYMV